MQIVSSQIAVATNDWLGGVSSEALHLSQLLRIRPFKGGRLCMQGSCSSSKLLGPGRSVGPAWGSSAEEALRVVAIEET